MTDLQILDTYGYTMCPARSEFPTIQNTEGRLSQVSIHTNVPQGKPPFGSSTSRRLRDFGLAT